MVVTDTIFALSSGRLPAGVAIVRLSGPAVRFAIETLFGKVPVPNVISHGSIRSLDGDLVDRGLVVFFEGPRSFTGEDCGEFHLHGGNAVVQKLFDSLAKLNHIRPAEAGEFSRRAFMNGKIDLTQAEGLADLIAAETEGQRRLALRQADGLLQRFYEVWRSGLVRARSLAEAAIDFSDEDDVATSAMDGATAIVDSLADEMRRHLAGYRSAEIVRDGYNIVILGAPNSGKSSLINAFARREVAIVTEEAGTTRDLIDVRLDLGGNLVTVTDTAGLRDDAGLVEAIGISRAVEKANQADLVLLLEDASSPLPISLPMDGLPVLRVGNKADLLDEINDSYDFLVSAATGQGIAQLLDRISEMVSLRVAGVELFALQDRHRRLVESCLVELELYTSVALSADLAAEHLRRASDYLGKLSGRIDMEEVLGEIFSRFCIGK